jgi:acylphosphatase
MTTQQVFYEGRVQGVGFRYATKQIAMGFEVTGWVRNTPDGRVELQVSGDEEEVDAFLQEGRDSHLAPHIRGETKREIPSAESSVGFSIRV